MTDLDKLIEAVDGGDEDFIRSDGWIISWQKVRHEPDRKRKNGVASFQLAWKAYEGSLDAAKALHEALLPHLRAGVMTDGSCQMFNEHGVEIGPECCSDVGPARSWLIAILKAYRALQ